MLVVEDEYFLQADLEKALTDAGFAVKSVSSGEEALTLFIDGNTTCTALIIDVRLRGSVTGREVARRIREREPALPVITGSSAQGWAAQGVPNSLLVSKPFGVAQLVTAVATLLNNRTDAERLSWFTVVLIAAWNQESLAAAAQAHWWHANA